MRVGCLSVCLSVVLYASLGARRDDADNGRIRLMFRATGDASTQYVLQDAQPPHLFVIRQETKTEGGYDMPVAAYYILDGTVYQSPSLYDVFYSRFVRYYYGIRGGMTIELSTRVYAAEAMWF